MHLERELIQWDLDLTKSLGTGQICSLNGGVRYIENLDITNLRGNDQNVRYIEVIVNDWFITQVTSVMQFNAIFVTQKCRVLSNLQSYPLSLHLISSSSPDRRLSRSSEKERLIAGYVLRCNSLSMVAFSINYFHFWADAQLLFTKNDTFRVAI